MTERFITLQQFLDLFSKTFPPSLDDFIANSKVCVRGRMVPLVQYLKEHSSRDITNLYEHVIHREAYLTRFYKLSLRVLPQDTKIEEQTANTLNNNKQPLLKNQIRNLFLKEILCDTKSGFDNIPCFLEVLFNLYQYPGTIIDYKLISPSAIDYIKKGRIGSVFSSFYFRASIMNPALVHNIRMNFFPNARNILTPTLGWCSYLTGFSLLKEQRLNHYVGIDVIDRVCNQLTQPPLALYPPSKIDVFNCPSELVMERHPEFTTCYRGYFDVVFFSPPYFKMELYDCAEESGKNQSTTMYKSYDEWLKGYWEKTVIMCRETLNTNGGLFCYIVSPFDQYDLPHDLELISKKYFTLQHIVPIYNKGVNSTKHREPDDKLYIYT